MDYVVIDGKARDVLVVEVEENFNILYSENTGRTVEVGAPMTLDPLGTFIGHKVKFKRKSGFESEYDTLFNELMQPRTSGIPIKIVHNQSVIEYEAYVSNGSRKLKRIFQEEGKVLWGEFEANFIPIRAQVEV